jgi:hypothetical protein
MALLSPTDAVLSVGRSIGRYFSIVSFLPALVLVLWTYVLVASGAWSAAPCPVQHKAPCLDHAQMALTHWSLAKVTGFVVVALVVALFLHPLQFATTRMLEGYWGPSSIAVSLMTMRILFYRRQHYQLTQTADTAGAARTGLLDAVLQKQFEADPEDPGDDPANWTTPERAERQHAILDSKDGERYAGLLVAEQQAATRARADFPVAQRRVMPTRLGNALRRFEDAAGSQYGLSAITIAPILHLIIPPRHFEYLTDARQEMDTSIRLCLVSLIATAMSFAFLLRDGWWLLLTLVPYGLAYIAYRGAVSSAHGYGVVFARVVDLNRFALYEELRVPQPTNAEQERASNRRLMRLLDPYDADSQWAKFTYRSARR